MRVRYVSSTCTRSLYVAKHVTYEATSPYAQDGCRPAQRLNSLDAGFDTIPEGLICDCMLLVRDGPGCLKLDEIYIVERFVRQRRATVNSAHWQPERCKQRAHDKVDQTATRGCRAAAGGRVLTRGTGSRGEFETDAYERVLGDGCVESRRELALGGVRDDVESGPIRCAMPC